MAKRRSRRKAAGQSQPQPDQDRTTGQGDGTPAPASAATPKAPTRKEQVEARAAARRRSATIRRIAVAIIAVVLVAGAWAAIQQVEARKPGERVAQQPSPHLKEGEAEPTYLTDPPTSGRHVDKSPPWGVHTEPISKSLQVHGLEDGGVIVHYRPDVDSEIVDELTRLVQSYATEVILAPSPELSHPIVLTAWTRIDRLEEFDEARIRAFVDAYRGIDQHGRSGS